ncbi:MAG: outer membrane lipoprotein-sorting protein [Treponema sp.]|jgi:outer membrane lipoprotein-sorting protein|nr:outer membrane lipoprotein-sorting protein [Treponema sp.]
MKRGIVFVLIIAAGLFPASAQNTGAPDAASIMQAVKERIRSDTMSSRSRMVITAKNGSTTERVIDQYSKDDAKGYARTIIVFQSPATVKGTRFLMMDNESGTSDQWIFLPGPGKIRRIAASEGGGSFMGTDFSYDDMSSLDRDVELDTHSISGEERLDETACYVIQSIPKDKDFLYSKTVSWIDKTNYRVYKREMYDKRGNLVKVMEVSGYRDIQGRDAPTQTKVSTIAAGTSTTIYMDIVKYDDPVPDGVFSTAYLETGRLR